MPDDIPATLPNRGDGEGPRSRGVLALMAARWAQIAEPFRETDFDHQDPWFDPSQFDPSQFDPSQFDPPRQSA